ncbi:DUF86 domain-containing protein [Bacteroides sp.]|uniref:HepT-like ribonuclease domain-containing protein n=1 Tax=Bacteroides sp. TaxID=29523 RepID=UPI003AB38C5F
MFNPTRILSLLDRIEDAIILINENTSYIKSPDNFLCSSDGMFTLSGVCMQLVFIGESVKVIDTKTDHSYLPRYTNIPWVGIMGLRDIIAHEYHHIDVEEIFKVIKNDLPILLETVKQMKKDLSA